MAYIMAYAAAVPDDRKDDYKAHAVRMAQIFKDHGANRIVECWGDLVPPGDVTSFPIAVQAAEGETVVMGWQEWPSKDAQQAGMPKAMSDPRAQEMTRPPMDGKRMIFAGFETLVDI